MPKPKKHPRGALVPPKPQRHGRKEGWTPKPKSRLKPSKGKVDTDSVRFVLALVEDRQPLVRDIDELSQDEKEQIYDWAMRVHLRASDNIIRVPTRPCVLDRL